MNDIRMNKILCPVDFSQSSDHALTYALEMARTFDAQLTLLHVVEVPFLPSYAMAGVPDLSLPMEQIEEGARKGLARLADQCRTKHDKVATELRTGTAFMEIITFARQLDADLVVVGTHGRTGLSHLIIGSVAERVVRKAPCPVLSIRHPEHVFKMP